MGLISLSQRFFHYAGNSICIEYEDPLVEVILDTIVYPFPSTEPQGKPVAFQVKIRQEPRQKFFIYQDGNVIYHSTHQVDFAEMLLSKICHQLAMDSQGGMLLHAAGLGWKNQGILVPGGIGFGKSTFTTWMLAQGFDYYSDEFVYIPLNFNHMVSFYRPLHLKKPSRDVLTAFRNLENSHLYLEGTHSDLVHPAWFNPASRYAQPPIQFIFFPHYLPKGELHWQPLSQAETGLELAQCLINARNLPGHGFTEIARIARMAPAVKFTYSSFNQIEPLIQNLKDSL